MQFLRGNQIAELHAELIVIVHRRLAEAVQRLGGRAARQPNEQRGMAERHLERLAQLSREYSRDLRRAFDEVEIPAAFMRHVAQQTLVEIGAVAWEQ